MGERLRIDGTRDVRATLDGGDADAVVVAAPPHPRHGGSRSDARLRAVSGRLTEAGVDCLRIDYGPWDEGRGERTDVRDAVAWARGEYERVGLFGYSFGASVALLAAAEEPALGAASALAPTATLAGEAVDAAVRALPCPGQVIAGEADGTVDWRPVVAAAREAGHETETVPGDHFFGGQQDRIASLVGDFQREELGIG